MLTYLSKSAPPRGLISNLPNDTPAFKIFPHKQGCLKGCPIPCPDSRYPGPRLDEAALYFWLRKGWHLTAVVLVGTGLTPHWEIRLTLAPCSWAPSGPATGLGEPLTLTPFGDGIDCSVIYSINYHQPRICGGSQDPIKMHQVLFCFSF